MRIVISSYTFLPDIGGVATNVSILAEAFASLGNSVTVVTLSEGACDGYAFEVVRRPNVTALFNIYRHADILILSNLSIKLFYPLLVLRRTFALRHHSESACHLTGSWRPFDLMRRWIVRRGVNFATSAFIGRRLGVPHHVVHPFANQKHMRTERVPLLDRQGALFVGRLVDEKGILYLLDRWELVKRRLGVTTLHIIGDGPLRESIEARIKAEQMIGVRMLGAKSLSETAQWMRRASFSFVPSLWDEPFGAVATESLASGAIVIRSNRGGLPETTGTLGYGFEPEDEYSFEDALTSAKLFHDKLTSDASAQEEYWREVDAHIARFDPKAAAIRIITVMTNPACINT